MTRLVFVVMLWIAISPNVLYSRFNKALRPIAFDSLLNVYIIVSY